MLASPGSTPAKGFGRLWNRRNRYYLVAFLFVLPALINFTVFRYLPIAAAFRASLYQYSLLGGFGDFIGLDQYHAIFSDSFSAIPYG